MSSPTITDWSGWTLGDQGSMALLDKSGALLAEVSQIDGAIPIIDGHGARSFSCRLFSDTRADKVNVGFQSLTDAMQWCESHTK